MAAFRHFTGYFDKIDKGITLVDLNWISCESSILSASLRDGHFQFPAALIEVMPSQTRRAAPDRAMPNGAYQA